MARSKAMRMVPGIVVMIIFLMSSIPVSAVTEGGKRGHEGHRGRFGPKEDMMQKIMDELDLSDEQRAQIKEFHTAQREEKEGSFKEMREKREALRVELEKYNHDPATVSGLIDEITAMQKKMLEKRVESVVGIKQILSEEQFNQLQEKMKTKMEEHKKQRKEKRGEELPPPPDVEE